MDIQFYSRATGKLRKVSYTEFGTTNSRKTSTSTVYTLDETASTAKQYPTGSLSPSQKKYIESFLQGITCSKEVNLDVNVRGIHWIGFWLSEDSTTIVSCTTVQPHVSNGMVHLSGIGKQEVADHAAKYFNETDNGKPSVTTPCKNPQLHGKFAIPLADSLIYHKLINSSQASFNLVVFSQMQPIFTVCNEHGTYRCRLTHNSCRIMYGTCPENVGIVGPTSSGRSYSFRSKDIVGSSGTGPCSTVHVSGTLQYQGKPDSANDVGKCFKECLESVMNSSSSGRFINSLALM